MIRYYFRRLGSNERGAAMIEFALVALLLFTLLFGIIEFGWVFFGWITLTGAVREGARLAIVGESFGDVKDAVEEHAFVFELETPSVTSSGSGSDRTVTVSVTGDLPLLIGFFLPNPLSLSANSTMLWESGQIPVGEGDNDNGDNSE